MLKWHWCPLVGIKLQTVIVSCPVILQEYLKLYSTYWKSEHLGWTSNKDSTGRATSKWSWALQMSSHNRTFADRFTVGYPDAALEKGASLKSTGLASISNEDQRMKSPLHFTNLWFGCSWPFNFTASINKLVPCSIKSTIHYSSLVACMHTLHKSQPLQTPGVCEMKWNSSYLCLRLLNCMQEHWFFFKKINCSQEASSGHCRLTAARVTPRWFCTICVAFVRWTRVLLAVGDTTDKKVSCYLLLWWHCWPIRSRCMQQQQTPVQNTGWQLLRRMKKTRVWGSDTSFGMRTLIALCKSRTIKWGHFSSFLPRMNYSCGRARVGSQPITCSYEHARDLDFSCQLVVTLC